MGSRRRRALREILCRQRCRGWGCGARHRNWLGGWDRCRACVSTGQSAFYPIADASGYLHADSAHFSVDRFSSLCTARWVIQPRFACQTMVCFAIPSAASPVQQTEKSAPSCLKIKTQNYTRLVLACQPQISSPPGFYGNATPLTRGDQRWSTFLKNHAKVILACDFFIAVTATFRMLYVFVVIEHGSRRLKHVAVTAHPSADWTLQQLREVVCEDSSHQYLLHDRDRIFAKHLDESIKALGLSILKSPPRSPKSNSICERVIGTIRRECLDWLIPMTESHLREILKCWVAHYNGGRPHSSLGPSLPGPPNTVVASTKPSYFRHRLEEGDVVRSKSVLGGLHHEYSLVPAIV